MAELYQNATFEDISCIDDFEYLNSLVDKEDVKAASDPSMGR